MGSFAFPFIYFIFIFIFVGRGGIGFAETRGDGRRKSGGELERKWVKEGRREKVVGRKGRQ